MIVKERARKARARRVRLIFTAFRRHFARFITHLYSPLFFPQASCHLEVPYYFSVIASRLRMPFLLLLCTILLLFSYHYFFSAMFVFCFGIKNESQNFCVLEAIMRISLCHLDEEKFETFR